MDEGQGVIQAGGAPSPASPAPSPSSWLRVQRRGWVGFIPFTIQPTPPQGWLEAAVDSVATNFDVIIDWGEAVYNALSVLEAAISVQGLPGTPRVQLGVFRMRPTTGVFFSQVNFPGTCYCRQSSPGSTQFLVHGGGVAGLVWSLDLKSTGFVTGEAITNLVCTGIAHGREL